MIEIFVDHYINKEINWREFEDELSNIWNTRDKDKY